MKSFKHFSIHFSKSMFWLLILIIDIHRGFAVHSGSVAEPGQFPYVVALVSHGYAFCGGAIISKDYILTAAHCFDCMADKKISVIAGETHVGLLSEAYKVKKIYLHPKYVSGKRSSLLSCFKSAFFCTRKKAERPKNDIAVLWLQTSLSMSKNIDTIKLPISDALPYGSKCYLAGFGETENIKELSPPLRWIELSIQPSEVCDNWLEPIKDEKFCALYTEKESAPLEGDSGSPLVCDGNLYGIASSGPCNPTTPSVYTHVYLYRKFIAKFLQK